jgi:phenylacetate-CoA ligase
MGQARRTMSPTSAVEGIIWPPLPGARASAQFAILFQLDQSQWWPAEDLRRCQAMQLAELARHAADTVPFYRGRLAGVGDWPDFDPLGEAWLGLPLLTRADIQTAGDALLSRAMPAGHGRTGEIFTSGSTGRPIRAVRSELWGLFWSAFTVRDHLWHRRDLRGTLAAIRESGKGKDHYPDGTTTHRWGPASGGLFATGPTVSLNITTPIPQQMEWLQRRNPDYLLTHPTIAHRLAQHSLKHGLRLPRLKQIESISEILRPATREIVAAGWGVRSARITSTIMCSPNAFCSKSWTRRDGPARRGNSGAWSSRPCTISPCRSSATTSGTWRRRANPAPAGVDCRCSNASSGASRTC